MDGEGPGSHKLGGSSLSVRDTRRMVQVLAPGVPPAVLDYVFASVTKAGSSSTRTASPVARYTLRRCESGDAGELALLDVSSLKDAHPDWANADALKFSYQPPPTQQPAGRDGKGR
ncbi:hypothetical protein CHLRE_03g195000v5 [Chlamydomonas reinhardtii]|uniref:Uncharacterized protein n=1 Tax=Chlamydomonas reinhardtii TaxID=3055 RepID=A8IWN2_CHLRE|nr:uncharacterized protein CHLRE_03g195000v5 [Chlamydomonas reinhardtii]PNW85617.1 hypothetical protein CHLRE_03g195000v5 [Chlamydomonas reinhardtii]|eukprot:XP_001693276.1 predicted protein [Chlamydomonas reinhardtii]